VNQIKSLQFSAAPNYRARVWMVLIALALRLVVVAFVYPDHLNPDRNYWRFGGEAASIGESLAKGRGFGNPFFVQTGPTAWMPPVYPLLVSGVFRLFGVYTKTSALALLSLNSLFSALTCLPVFALARIGFGERAAKWAGWGWAFFPYAIHFSSGFIWPTTLTTFLLPVLILWILRLESAGGPRAGLCFGLAGGVAALNDPIVFSVLPALAVWLYWRRRQKGYPWKVPATAMAVGFVLIVAPWFVRNYRTFHIFVPFRPIFGLELHIGNHGDASHFAPGADHPSNDKEELLAYSTMGERAYMEMKKAQAVEFITSHPAWFAGVTVRRIFYMWTSFWSLDAEFQAQEPFDLANVFLTTVVDLIAFAGLWRAFRSGSLVAVPFALALLLFPLVYYVTHWEDYYRRPIDPVIVVLAAYELSSRFSGARIVAPVGSGLLNRRMTKRGQPPLVMMRLTRLRPSESRLS
jgi:4-amino-4-deoxy-L-arabinose transferase-like glycosyltransferase